MTLLYTYLFACFVIAFVGSARIYNQVASEYKNIPGHPITDYPTLTSVTVFVLFMIVAPFLAYVLINDSRTERYIEGLKQGFKQA